MFGTDKRSRGPKALYNPIPPNKRLANPTEIEEMMQALQVAHEHALAEDKSGTVALYGPSTWLTALSLERAGVEASDTDSSSSSSSGDDDDDNDDSGGVDTTLVKPSSVQSSSSDSTPASMTVEQFYEQFVALNNDTASVQCEPGTPHWFEERRKRVTATFCKKVACRHSSDFTSLLCEKLSGGFRGNKCTRYGQQHEKQALQVYLQFKKQAEPMFSLESTGLIVKMDEPWIAATPDSLANDPVCGVGVVEVKCPITCRNQTLQEAAKAASFCLAVNAEDSSLVLKKTHQYFYQVQHQMYVCNVQWADFVVWTPKQVFIQRVARDTQFFASVHAKLKAFYFEHLLPAVYAEHM